MLTCSRQGICAHQETTTRMLSSKLFLLLIGSFAISACLAAEEDWGLDDEPQEVSSKVHDFADEDDDDDDDNNDDVFAMERDDLDNINELLGRELARNVAKGQWRWVRRTVRRVGRFFKKHVNCKNAKRACYIAKRFRNPKVYAICGAVKVACFFG